MPNACVLMLSFLWCAAVVVAVCEKILVDNPYHYAVGYAAFYVLLLSVRPHMLFAAFVVAAHYTHLLLLLLLLLLHALSMWPSPLCVG